MKNWNRSEIVAVVALVALIGFLAYVGMTVELEGDLVGKATSTTYAQATPYFYNGGWNSALPSKGVAYVYVSREGKSGYVYNSYDASHTLVNKRLDTHPPSSSSGSSSSGGFLDTSTGVLRDADGNPILSSGSDGAATSGGAAPGGTSTGAGTTGGASTVEYYSAPASGAAPAPAPGGGTTGATIPPGYKQVLDDPDGVGPQSPRRSMIIPQVLGPVTNWEGNSFDASGHRWSTLDGGQTVKARNTATNEVYQYTRRGGNYLYTVTNQEGKVTQASIGSRDGSRTISPDLVPQIVLDPNAHYIVTGYNSVTVTSQRGGVRIERTLTSTDSLHQVTDVTTTTVGSNPSITSTKITQQLDGGGTATWSGGETDKPGSLFIRDARGDTWSFDSVQINVEELGYGSKKGPVFFDPATQILYTGQKDDRFDRHEIQFLEDGSTRDRELYDDNKIDEEFIYYKNGDLAETTFNVDANGDKTTWASRERYNRNGQLQRMTFANDDRYAYVDVADYFRIGRAQPNADGTVTIRRADANSNGWITRDEAIAFGVPSNIWDTIDANHDNILNDVTPFGNEHETVLRVELNPDDTLGTPVDAQTESQAETVDGDTEIEKNFETFEDKSDAGVLGNLFAGYQSYQGLSNLLFGKAFLNDWREKVDEQFARAYLGIDYWTSAICQDEFDVVGDSVAAVETAGGLVQFIGTVQGEVAGSVPVMCDDQDKCKVGTCRKRDKVCVDSSDKVILEHFYKITYGVVAPSDQRLTPYYDEDGAISFNIVVSGRDKTASLFTTFVELDNGQSAASKAPKKSPILHFSPVVYDRVCLVFGKKAVDRNGDNVDQACNPIKAATGSFENFQRNTAGAPIPNRGEPEFNGEW